MRNIIGKIAFGLYSAGVVFYLLYDNHGLDTGIPGYLVKIQFQLFGTANERWTIYLATAILFAPLAILVGFLGKRKKKLQKTEAKPTSEVPETLVAAGVVVAVIALTAIFFFTHEIAAIKSAKIYETDLGDASKTLPEDARYVSMLGRIQDHYSYTIQSTRFGRAESFSTYAPITARTWTPDQPITYVTEIRYGYDARKNKLGTPAEPYQAEILPSGVPTAVAQAYEHDAHLKLANTVYLLSETAFIDGKPRDDYVYIEPYLPWLIPVGLPLAAVLFVTGLIGLRIRQGPAMA